MKNSEIKKIWAIALSAVMCLGAAACGGGSGSLPGSDDSSVSSVSSGSSETSSASETGDSSDETSEGEKINFTVAYSGGNAETIAAGGSVTVEISKNIGRANYLKIDVSSDVNLRGKYYWINSDENESLSEEFFIEKDSETPFYQIIDWYSRVGEPYRENDQSLYKLPETWYERKEYTKRLEKIVFENVSEESGTLTVGSVETAERELVLDKTVYLENEYIRAGINLGWGGGVGYLTRVDKNIQQVIADGENKIGVNYASKYPESTLVGDYVNLINSSTAGRSAQVSLYGLNMDTEEYTRGIYRTTKGPWPYNPVQCGDQWDTHSTVVDYRIDDGEIYVKTRSQDWATCEPTDSYTECTYSIDGKTVKAVNRFYDWSGLEHNMVDASGEVVANKRNQEVPALSAVVPLHTMVLYEGSSPWTGGELTTYKNLGYWSVATGNAGQYLSTTKAAESWAAWVNEENFGLGLYVPDITKAVAGRHLNYTLNFSGLATDQIQFNYLTFLGVFALHTYEALEYEFYLTADNVTTMRKTFKALEESGECGNETLLAWQQK